MISSCVLIAWVLIGPATEPAADAWSWQTRGTTIRKLLGADVQPNGTSYLSTLRDVVKAQREAKLDGAMLEELSQKIVESSDSSATELAQNIASHVTVQSYAQKPEDAPYGNCLELFQLHKAMLEHAHSLGATAPEFATALSMGAVLLTADSNFEFSDLAIADCAREEVVASRLTERQLATFKQLWKNLERDRNKFYGSMILLQRSLDRLLEDDAGDEKTHAASVQACLDQAEKAYSASHDFPERCWLLASLQMRLRVLAGKRSPASVAAVEKQLQRFERQTASTDAKRWFHEAAVQQPDVRYTAIQLRDP